MRDMTLSILLKDNKICLGEKKRGFAKGVLNGFGGKVEDGEEIIDAMIREVQEEVHIDIKKEDLQKVGLIHFTIKSDPKHNSHIHIYNILKYSGVPSETEEIRPFWVDIDSIPYSKMWPDDIIWLPRVLAGETDIEYEFIFNTMEEGIESWKCIK